MAPPAPVPPMTTTATNTTTSLPSAPLPLIAPKAHRSYEQATPATKQEEAMPVPLNKEIGTSTEAMAPSEEKEKEGEQAAAAPKKEGDEAAKTTPPVRPRMRRGFKVSTF